MVPSSRSVCRMRRNAALRTSFLTCSPSSAVAFIVVPGPSIVIQHPSNSGLTSTKRCETSRNKKRHAETQDFAETRANALLQRAPVLALLISEVLGHREPRERHPGSRTRGLVHLAVDQRGLRCRRPHSESKTEVGLEPLQIACYPWSFRLSGRRLEFSAWSFFRLSHRSGLRQTLADRQEELSCHFKRGSLKHQANTFPESRPRRPALDPGALFALGKGT